MVPDTDYPPFLLDCQLDNSIYDMESKQPNAFNKNAQEFIYRNQQVPISSQNGYSVPSPINFRRPSEVRPKVSRPRLCHFLVELLANPSKYSKIIEWVDQNNGVFKFLDSAEVASEWGRRRNKPHMKYENFARSLRTYIAKGILTKPRSKLVYRFTSKVV